MRRATTFKKYLLLGLLGLAGGLSAAELIHNPVLSAAAGQDLEVQANLVGADGEIHVRLYYRPKGKEIYRSLEMGGPLSDLRASVPGTSVAVSGLEYYMEAVQISAGKKTVLATSPASNPALNPHNVAVRRDETGPEVTPLSPADGETVDSSQPVITAAMGDADSGVDATSVLIKIDGELIKDKEAVQAFESVVSYLPTQSLSDGEHEIIVTVRDKAGNPGSAKWHITVKAGASGKQDQAKRSWGVDGKIGAETQYGAVLTQPVSQATSLPYRPYGANRARLEVNARNDSETVSLKVYKTDEERTDQQPLDRYNLSWRNRQGMVSLGDVSPSFSELSLYNLYQLRGLDLDLRSGRLDEGHTRLMGVWGQTRRAIEQGSTGLAGGASSGTYAQWLYGARWEFGNQYFLMGLNTVSAYDDKDSVTNPGSSIPHYNSIMTSDVRIGLPFAWLSLNGEAGVDTFSADPTLLGLSVGSAYKAGLLWDARPIGTRINFDWKDLGGSFGLLPGGYSTMANPGLQSDYRGFESGFSQKLFDGQFGLDLGLNRWRDNLQGVKLATTTNDYLSVFTSIAPNYWPSLTVGYTQSGAVNDGDGNTSTGNFKADYKTSAVNVALGYNHSLDEKRAYSLNLSVLTTGFVDQAALRTTQDLQSTNVVLTGFYTMGLSSFTLSGGLGTAVNPDATLTAMPVVTTVPGKTATTVNGSGRWNQQWSGTPLDSYLGWDYYGSSSEISLLKATTTSARNTGSLGGGYKISNEQRLSLGLSLALITTQSDTAGTVTNDSLSQLYSNLKYDLTF